MKNNNSKYHAIDKRQNSSNYSDDLQRGNETKKSPGTNVSDRNRQQVDRNKTHENQVKRNIKGGDDRS